MIVINKNSGLIERIGYKDLAKKYLEFYDTLNEENFVVNMIFMLDDWETREKVKFERLMPSDWEMILKAIRVLNIEPKAIVR